MPRAPSSFVRGFAAVCVIVSALVACRKPPPPELAAARGELGSRAAAACATPAPRPTHRAAPSHVNGSDGELRQALVAICEEARGDAAFVCDDANATGDACRAALAAAEKHLRLTRDRLTDPKPTVAMLRRSELLFSAPAVDLEKLTFDAAVASTAAAGARSCDPSTLRLEKFLLAAARQASAAHDDAGAMSLCADVAALQRDRFLVGGMIDAMLGTAALGLLERTCLPIVEATADAAVEPLRAAMAIIRKSCPPSLDDVLHRDLDETFLVNFGALRDESVTLSCDRAKRLAEHAPRAVTRDAQDSVVDGYRAYKSATPPDRAKYDSEYAKALAIVDRFLTSRGR